MQAVYADNDPVMCSIAARSSMGSIARKGMCSALAPSARRPSIKTSACPSGRVTRKDLPQIPDKCGDIMNTQAGG
jgi:hypothetical protein